MTLVTRPVFPSILFLALFAAPGPARAYTNADARIAVTIQPHTTKSQCTTNAPQQACSGFVVEGDIKVQYDLYVFVANADPVLGIAGAAFGITYNGALGAGLDIFQWTRCTDLEFQGLGWPNAGGGNTLTFNSANCQRTERGTEGVHVVLGWFYCYAYGSDTFSIINRQIAIPDMKVADCAAMEYNLTGLVRGGRIGFAPGGGHSGCNPCIDAEEGCWVGPVDAVSWGKVKRAYQDE